MRFSNLKRSGGEGAESGRVQVRDVRPLAVHVPSREGIRGRHRRRRGRGARAERGRREVLRRRLRLRHALGDVLSPRQKN